MTYLLACELYAVIAVFCQLSCVSGTRLKGSHCMPVYLQLLFYATFLIYQILASVDAVVVSM